MAELAVTLFMLLGVLYEWRSGKYRDGKKSLEDWKMAGICTAAVVVFQRPLVMAGIFGICLLVIPQYQEAFTSFEQQYFVLAVIIYLMVEEFFHGLGHWFAHIKPVKFKPLRYIQGFYKLSHRPHHFSGGNDGKGQLSVTQTFVEGWGWWFIMPNFWFQFTWLYLGLYETFIYGTIIKGIWSCHNHVNWNYDLYFLNHKWKWVRTLMWGLCHIFTFPTQHHQHHSRSRNSAKNMTNFLALYDWLIFRTLVIEKEKPKIYGWRQEEKEEHSAFYRFFNSSIKKYV